MRLNTAKKQWNDPRMTMPRRQARSQLRFRREVAGLAETRLGFLCTWEEIDDRHSEELR